jgi:AraC family transcriptional regulator of arabinose operon
LKEDLYFVPGGNEIFTIELAGKSWCDGSYRIERQKSEIWVLEQVLHGTGTVCVDGIACSAEAGDVYLLPAGSHHLYYADPVDPWEKIFWNLQGTLPEMLFSVYGLRGMVLFPKSGTESLFEDFYNRLCKSVREPDFIQQAVLILHQICMKLHSTMEQPFPLEAVQMRNYLDQNLHRLVSIGELAGSIYRSADYANRLFRNTYGITPYAYLLERKMELACRLLESSAMPIREIAARLGYDDAQYFSGLFKQRKGVPPSFWRKGILSEKTGEK